MTSSDMMNLFIGRIELSSFPQKYTKFVNFVWKKSVYIDIAVDYFSCEAKIETTFQCDNTYI